jgi:hypothetical protein
MDDDGSEELQLRVRRLANLQARVSIQRDLIRHSEHRFHAASLVRPACDPESEELRRISHDLHALSASVEGNRVRLEALRLQTAAMGMLALEVTLLAASTSRALRAHARAPPPTDDEPLAQVRGVDHGHGVQLQPGLERSARRQFGEPVVPLGPTLRYGAPAASARSSAAAAAAEVAGARERLLRLGLRLPEARAAEGLAPRAQSLVESAGARILERLRSTLNDLDSPLGMPRALVSARLPGAPLCAPLDDCCAICLAPMQAGEAVVELACVHTFHGACIREACAHRAACPICRRPVPW